MDRHSFLASTRDRRLSLNSTHMANPIAESTCLNNNTSASKWFGKLSPRISSNQRSNSSICLSTSRSTPTRDQSNTSYMSPTRQKLNLSRIDPRVYADANSSGLVSRVLKYQEGERQLERSMSVNNLYNKPGQFPVVHLKKKELPYKASTHNISMTRIAPPDRTVYYGSTLSSLLRSNSIVGVHKTDEELSCENRPILHPPPTENEMAPTRSVLEVLKEISRKRINTNDLQPEEEIKKSCNREFDDFVDSPHPSTSAMSNINNGTSYKRQRDLVNHHQTMLPYVPMNATEMSQQLQKSPEQLAKRRHCNYNNDITSSLSSSIMHTNKRKLFEQKSGVQQDHSKTLGYINTTGSNNSSPETETQAAKIQRRQNDLRFQNMPKAAVWSTPITPLPATPYNQTVQSSRSFCEQQEKIPEAPPQRAVSAPEAVSLQKLTSTQVTSIKPKLTLFNKDYNQRNDHETDFGNADLDANDCTGINFVKPKKLHSLSGGSNPLIERTQKSKLALMLSGLRGEIYQDNELEDELDGKVDKTPANVVAPEKPTNDVISKDKNHPVTPNDKPTILSVETVKQAKQPEITKTTATATATSVTTTTTTTTEAATISNTQTSTANLVFSAPKSSAAQNTTIKSAAPTFNFGAAPTPSTQTTSAAATTASALTTSSVVTTTTANLETTTKPMFSFGSTATLAPTTTATATTVPSTLTITPSALAAKPLEFGGAAAKTAVSSSEISNTTAFTLNAGKTAAFSFGSTTKTTAIGTPDAAVTTSTTTTTTLATTALSFGNTSLTSGTLNFGGVGKTTTNTISPPFASSVKPADTAAKSFSFGVSSDAPASLPTTTSNNSIAPVKFSFGNAAANSILNANTTTGNAATTFTPAVTAAPTFGSAQSANLLFGGGINANTNANTEAAKLFSFGGASANASSITTATTTAAAASATTTTSQNLFSFAGASSQGNKPPTAAVGGGFSFSGGVASNANTNTTSTTTTTTFGAQPTNTSIFPFGGAAQGASAATATATAAPTATTTTSNIFGFGQKPAATSATFAFGGNNANTTANNQIKSNPNPTTTANAFTFGGGAPAAAAAANNNSKNEQTSNSSANIFSFGGGGAQNNNMAPNADANSKMNSIFGGNASSSIQLTAGVNKPSAATTFNFSSGNAAQKPFGSGAIGATTIMNGNNQGNNVTTAPAFSFGDQSKKPTTAVGGFSFNSVANTSNNASANTNTLPPNTGIVKPNFSFGSSTATINSNNNNNNAAANGSSATSFGALAGTTNNTFAFGSTSNANAASTGAVTGGNIFGNSALSAKPPVPTGGFSFSAKSNLPAVNGQASNATSTPFAFGGGGTPAGAVSAATEAPKSFSFSGVASSNGPAATSGGNIFGSAQNAKPAAGTFNFGSATTNNLAMAAPTQNNNYFSIPSNGQQTDRPMRRATRRLQK